VKEQLKAFKLKKGRKIKEKKEEDITKQAYGKYGRNNIKYKIVGK
jgi:hypothetical protein